MERNDAPGEGEGGAARPKLQLKARTEEGVKAAEATSKPVKANPFGAARPREAVIAQRVGKDEKDLIREEAAAAWKPKVRPTPENTDRRPRKEDGRNDYWGDSISGG